MPNILYSTKHREQWACLHTANAIVNLLGLVAFKNNFSFSLLVWKSSRPSSACLDAQNPCRSTLELVPKTKMVLRLNLYLCLNQTGLPASNEEPFPGSSQGRHWRYSPKKAKAVTHGGRVKQALSSWRCSKPLMLHCQSLIIVNNSVITILITREAEFHWWFFGSFQQNHYAQLEDQTWWAPGSDVVCKGHSLHLCYRPRSCGQEWLLVGFRLQMWHQGILKEKKKCPKKKKKLRDNGAYE